MPLLLLNVCFDKSNPRALSADARAVAAEPYVHLDDLAGNPGGITRADVDPDDVRLLGDFGDGAELFVEGEPDDMLDNTNDETAATTRIWWRATVVER